MATCIVEGCQQPRSRSCSRCKEHDMLRRAQAYGMCPNHPDRAIWTRKSGVCSSCTKKLWRRKHLITDDVYSRNQDNEEATSIIYYIATEIGPVREQLAHF